MATLSWTIPTFIGKLRNLTKMSLHGNKFSGGIPLELFDCINLVSLDLGTNRLTGPIPKSILQLKQLDNLVLSENQLLGTIPDEICSGFQKVPLLDSEYVQHYYMLDLAHNKLVGSIPSSNKQCIIVSDLFLQPCRVIQFSNRTCCTSIFRIQKPSGTSFF